MRPFYRLTEPLIRATQYAGHEKDEAHPAQEATRAFTIALSRQVGARGTMVARAAGRRLNWPVYDHEILERIANDLHVKVTELESVDERHASWLYEGLSSFASAHPVTETRFVRRLAQTIHALAARGECLIVGRGAPFLLPEATTLRVRLFGAWEDRVATIQQERGLGRAEAERYVEATGQARARFIQDHFHRNPDDPRNYDLLLNMSRLEVEEAADLLCASLRYLQNRATQSEVERPVERRLAR